jgi:hypothetical protein
VQAITLSPNPYAIVMDTKAKSSLRSSPAYKHMECSIMYIAIQKVCGNQQVLQGCHNNSGMNCRQEAKIMASLAGHFSLLDIYWLPTVYDKITQLVGTVEVYFIRF